VETFVVRVWVEPIPVEKEPTRLRGVIEHVGSGSSTTFTDDDALLAFLYETRTGATSGSGRKP
jgi:hypothetical protein